jgi:hypothetical protein
MTVRLNIAKLIKEDEVLSRFDFETVYRVILRLVEIGNISK